MTWIAAHIADIAILLVVAVVCALIVRGMRKGSCTIVSEDPLDEEALRAAIADTGYELTSLESGPQKKRGFLPFL